MTRDDRTIQYVGASVGGGAWSLRVLVVTALGFGLLNAYDTIIYHALLDPPIEEIPDWYSMLRVCGFAGTWAVAALAWTLVRRPGAPSLIDAARPGLLVLLCASAGGLAAEILKPILRRERPNMHDGDAVFRPFLERTLSGGGLDLPSSHAATAFAASFALCFLLPRAAPVWILLAVGCAYTRLKAGAHFASSVWLAAGLALLFAGWIFRAERRLRAASNARAGL